MGLGEKTAPLSIFRAVKIHQTARRERWRAGQSEVDQPGDAQAARARVSTSRERGIQIFVFCFYEMQRLMIEWRLIRVTFSFVWC